MRVVLLAVLVVASFGCRNPQTQPTPPPGQKAARLEVKKPELVRGLLAWKEGTISLDPCGEAPPRTVTDDSNGDLTAATKPLVGDLGTPLYVEVLVRQEATPALVEVRRAAPAEIDGCAESWEGVQVRSGGTEPFWAIEVAGKTLRYASPEGSFEVPATNVEALAWKGASSEHELGLRLEEKRCANGMSGEVLPYTAHAVLDGRPLEGCANARLGKD